MARYIFIFLLAGMCITSSISAQNTAPDHLPMILKQVGVTEDSCYMIRVKALPHMPELSVMVIPVITYQDDYSMELDSYIFVIENATGKIRHRFSESSTWFSDAMRLYDITIDTAPYMLDEKTRAFGIRVSYSGGSNPNSLTEKNMSLFVPVTDSLIRVLKDFPVYFYHNSWDLVCNAESTEENKILVMSEQAGSPYRDIIIKNTVTTSVSKGTSDEDCKTTEKKELKKQLLQYKNGRYEVKSP